MCTACCRQGFYDTMDAGIFTEEGNIAVMARSDDVINVAGHRLSAGALEEVADIFCVTCHLLEFHLRVTDDHIISCQQRKLCDNWRIQSEDS